MARSVSRSRSPSPKADRRSPSRSVSRSRSPSPRDNRRDERRSHDDGRGQQREERRPRRDESGESNSVLVRHLNFRTTGDELKRIFGEFGEVGDVYLPLDYHSRRPRGFGFVQFRSADDAHAACKGVDGTEIDGNTVEVVIAKQNRKSPGAMRKVQSRGERSDYGRGRRGDSRERTHRRSRSRSTGRRYDDRRQDDRRDDRRRERY